MGVEQERIHLIKINKLKALILEIDLVKSYYKFNWTFMTLILFQIGLNLEVVN